MQPVVESDGRRCATSFLGRYLVVVHGQIPFGQEAVILGVEDRLLDVLAGEALDACRDSQKLRVMTSALSPSGRQCSQAPRFPGVAL